MSNDIVNMDLRQLIANWNTSNKAAEYRNEIRKRASSRGLRVEEYIEQEFKAVVLAEPPVASEPDELAFNHLSVFREEIKDVGWNGFGLEIDVETLDTMLERWIDAGHDYDSLSFKHQVLLQTAENYFDVWYAETHNDFKREIIFPRKKGDKLLRENKSYRQRNKAKLRAKS